MIAVKVKEGESIDRALKRFKRKCQQAGVYRDYRKASYYIKPSERRKMALQKSIQRHRKAMRLSGRT